MAADNDDAEDRREPGYTFRPSALGAPRNFRLLDRAVAWEIGRRSGVVTFDRITRVRMSFRPATMQTHRFVTEIWSVGTPRLDIVSSSWKSMTEQVNQGDDYRAFIGELHRRLAASGAHVRFDAGISPLIYCLGVVMFVAATIAFVGLTLRMIETSVGFAALMVGAFLLLFLWQGGNIFYRNRPGSYRPDSLPPALLPRAKA